MKGSIGRQGHFSRFDFMSDFFELMDLESGVVAIKFIKIQRLLSRPDMIIQPPGNRLDPGIPGIIGMIGMAVITGLFEQVIYFRLQG